MRDSGDCVPRSTGITLSTEPGHLIRTILGQKGATTPKLPPRWLRMHLGFDFCQDLFSQFSVGHSPGPFLGPFMIAMLGRISDNFNYHIVLHRTIRHGRK